MEFPDHKLLRCPECKGAVFVDKKEDRHECKGCGEEFKYNEEHIDQGQIIENLGNQMIRIHFGNGLAKDLFVV